MATVATLYAGPPYYGVRVAFADQQFDQLLISDKTGAELDAQLQAYADEYEQEWATL